MPSPERRIKEESDTIESFIDLLDNVNQFIDGVYNDLNVSRPLRFSIGNTTTNSIIRSLDDSPSSSTTYRTPPRNLRISSSGEFGGNGTSQVSLVRRRNMDADIENIDRICDNAERNLRSIGLSMYNSSSDSISEDASNENLNNSSSIITHQLPAITLNPASPVLSTIISNIQNSSDRRITSSMSSPSVPVVDLSDSVRTPERAQNNNGNDDDDVILISYDSSSVVDLCTPRSYCSAPRTIRNHNTNILNRRRLPHEVEIVDTCCGGPVSAKRRCSGTTEYKKYNKPLVAANKSELRSSPTNGTRPFLCPVCLESCLKREPTSTTCGHVFCKQCIGQAINLTHKCPLCNKKISKKDTFRIYL